MLSTEPGEVNGTTSKRTPVKVLLPHEVIHCLSTCCSPYAFGSIMLGNLSESARRAFFDHLKTLDVYSQHPVLCSPDVDFKRLIPVFLHADGAQFYRDDENFVWSFGSVFGSKGDVKDVLITKYPIAVIPERFMQDVEVPRLI